VATSVCTFKCVCVCVCVFARLEPMYLCLCARAGGDEARIFLGVFVSMSVCVHISACVCAR